MSDTGKLRLQAAAIRLASVLGETYVRATNANSPSLAHTALTYRDLVQGLTPLITLWVEQDVPATPLADRLAHTMESAGDLLQGSNLRGVLHQTHAVLSALPGLPDFPPIEVPPVPGSDE